MRNISLIILTDQFLLFGAALAIQVNDHEIDSSAIFLIQIN